MNKPMGSYSWRMLSPRGESYRGMQTGTRVRFFDGTEVRVVAVRTPKRVLLAPWRT
jgi:hypothetical protein